MATWGALQTLAGFGNDYAEAKRQQLLDALAQRQALSQLATAEQQRKASAHQQWLDDQMLKLYQQQGLRGGAARHLESKTVTLPDGTESLASFDPSTGQYFDLDGKQMSGIKPKAPAQKAAKLGPWQPPSKDSPLVGGMRMWSRDVVDPLTQKPTGEKQYGLPSVFAAPSIRHLFKQATDEDGNMYLVPVTETSERGVGGAASSGGAQSIPVPPKARATAPNTTMPNTTPNAPMGAGNIPAGAQPFGHKPLDAMSRRALVAANQSQDGLRRIQMLFSAHPELRKDNNPVTSFLNWTEYSRGHFQPKDPVRGLLIKEAALIGITAAGLYSQGRMSSYLFDKAQQHLPQPNDTPALLYDKVKWMADNGIIDQMIKDIKDPFRNQQGGGPQFDKGTVIINGQAMPLSAEEPR